MGLTEKVTFKKKIVRDKGHSHMDSKRKSTPGIPGNDGFRESNCKVM